MSPRAPNWIAGVCLALLMLTLALWVWSEQAFFVRIYASELYLIIPKGSAEAYDYLSGVFASFHPASAPVITGFTTPVYEHNLFVVRSVNNDADFVLAFPFWALAVIPAAGAAFGFSLLRRQRRRERDGCCLICGYDLRESNERCPECGTAVAKRKVLA